MQCLLLLVLFGVGLSCGQGITRYYFLQAENIFWDYAPGLTPTTDPQITFLQNGPDRIGSVYKKCVYRRYTDDTFQVRHPADDRSPGSKWEHLGTLGPVLRGVVGDVIFVVFKNTCDFPATVHAHGVFYTAANEGSNYLDKQFPGGFVPPGEIFAYRWDVLERSGPGPNDPSTIGWLYHSHVDEPGDTSTGLVGMLIIGRDDDDAPDGVPADVDRELITLFSVVDENSSHYLYDNILRFTQVTLPDIPALTSDPGFIESNLMHSINSYSFYTIPGLTARINDNIRWYVVGLGSEVDIHTAHWHANTLLHHGFREDVFDVFPAIVSVGDMLADNAGKWLLHCHVNDHIIAGMLGTYTILPA